MFLDPTLSDPDLGGTEFLILRKTWTQQSGVPELVDIQRIFTVGIIHPASPDALSRTPEESRHEPVYLIHSTEPLSLGEAGDNVWTAPDEIDWNGNFYRVVQVREWQAFGFWKALAVRV